MSRHPSFADVLRDRADRWPERRALTFLDGGEAESDTLTFGALDRDARAIAAMLQSRVRPGDRALLLYPPGLDFVRAFMGCLYAGVVAVPVYPPRRNRSLGRLTSVAIDAQPAIALTDRTVSKVLAQGGVPALNVPVIVADRGTRFDAAGWVAPALTRGDLAFLQYTSGSTGAPKGVMVTHGNLLHNNELIKTAFGHSSESVFVSWLPVFHDMGLVGMVLQPLYAGAAAVLMEPAAFLQKPVRWLRAITRYRGTTGGAPNSAYDLCARKVSAEDRASLDLSSWAFAFNGSEPVRASTIRRFYEMFAPCGLRLESIHPCYGMAETTLLVSIGAAGTAPVIQTGESGRTLVSSGRLWLEEQVVVVDPETREPRQEGAAGEIWIASPSVAAGYWNRPEETAAAFNAFTSPEALGPFFRTGDLGLLRDGELFVTGRLKDLIIIRGRNLYPQDVELTAERAHAAIARDSSAAFALAAGEADESERLVVVCEIARERLAAIDAGAVTSALRQAIAEEHEVDPEAIVLVRPLSIAKTSSGKIQRRACRDRFVSGTLEIVGEWRKPAVSTIDLPAPPVAGQPYEAIRDWLVARIAAQAGLVPGQLDVRSPFSRYGLDSQRAVVLSGELQDWLGRPLPATLAYDFPSIDALARHLAAAAPDRRAAAGGAVDTREPIAIVGIGCRFAGGGDTPDAFWSALRAGVDAIGPAPAARPHAAALGFAGFLDNVDGFDADFFGVTAREAEIMDPQQRLLLEVAWEAIEDAGITATQLAGTRTGVFVGISSRDYTRLQDGLAAATDPYAATGNALSIAANRLSYQLDLRGPSWAVDTACSSSLVAVHHACESLRRGESDAALAGGVNLILSPELTAVFSRAGMMSASHRCRTFDADADGYVRGEGAGLVVLKRLADAQRDGDTILALVRGSAVNQDGRSNGLTAPNGPAQQAVIRAALHAAGVAPASIQYVEAHGTGTRLGDPIEMNALMAVLAEGRPLSSRCWVGSVKTNVGHLEAAAGIAGLIKVVLAMRHREIPRHLHLGRVNPHIALDGTAFAIPTAMQAWESNGGPRLAGISSFGFGGTNAHVVLEEAPEPPPVVPDPNVRTELRAGGERPHHVIALSAKSNAALLALAASTASFLGAHPEVGVADAAFSANVGRTMMPHRIVAVSSSALHMAEQLEAEVRGDAAPGVFRGHVAGGAAPQIAFLFTGQGSQYPGMARDLFETQPAFREALTEIDAEFRRLSGASLLDVIYPAADAGAPLLDDTAYTQPALFAIACALTRLWKAWGVEPDAVMGHSVGEYAAACAAGMCSWQDALALVTARAQVMQALPRTGSMRAVFADVERVERAIAAHRDSIAVAAVNGPSSVVISGRSDLVDAVAADLLGSGIESAPLRTSHAFHSPLMRPIERELAQIAGGVAMGPPTIPIVSNLTGDEAGADMLAPAYWVRHALEPVRFADGVAALRAIGCRLFVEIGPKGDLLALAKSAFADAGDGAWIPSLLRRRSGWDTMLGAAAALSAAGVPIAWAGVDQGFHRRRVTLPAYPFQRQRYWIDETQRAAVVSGTSVVSGLSRTGDHPLLGHRLPDVAHAPDTRVWEASITTERLPYLGGHRMSGSAVLPYAVFIEMALAAAGDGCGAGPHRVMDLELQQPVLIASGQPARLQSVVDRRADGAWRFRVYNRVNSTWTLSASARLIEIPANHEIRPDVLCGQ